MKVKRISVVIDYEDSDTPTRIEYCADRYDLKVEGSAARQFARGWRAWFDPGEHMPTGLSTFHLSVVAKDSAEEKAYREWAATRSDVVVEPLERPAVSVIPPAEPDPVLARYNARCPSCGYPNTKDGEHFKGIYDSTKPCPHCHAGTCL